MREGAIQFKVSMVQAIQAGRKDTTRRVIDVLDMPDEWRPFHEPALYSDPLKHYFVNGQGHVKSIKCSYGAAGDLLWVREPWRTDAQHDHLRPSELPDDAKIYYEADGLYPDSVGRRRPPIFMPRRASRFTLRIAEIHPERLHDITNEGAIAEGIESSQVRRELGIPFYKGAQPNAWHIFPRDAFVDLWDSINQLICPWALNPWVWVIRFTNVTNTIGGNHDTN